MMKKYFVAATALFLFACHSNPKQENTEATDTAKVAEEIRSNTSYLYDFNAIEAVFGNENWMIIDKKDTSYFYASRLGPYTVNTYAYKIIKGDSSMVQHGQLKSESNNIYFDFDGKQLVINSAATGRITAQAGDSSSYEFVRLDSDRIQTTYPGGRKIIWKKTLSFSTFLVRSRYDYANGTRYAFDAVDFNKKKRN